MNNKTISDRHTAALKKEKQIQDTIDILNKLSTELFQSKKSDIKLSNLSAKTSSYRFSIANNDNSSLSKPQILDLVNTFIGLILPISNTLSPDQTKSVIGSLYRLKTYFETNDDNLLIDGLYLDANTGEPMVGDNISNIDSEISDELKKLDRELSLIVMRYVRTIISSSLGHAICGDGKVRDNIIESIEETFREDSMNQNKNVNYLDFCNYIFSIINGNIR